MVIITQARNVRVWERVNVIFDYNYLDTDFSDKLYQAILQDIEGVIVKKNNSLYSDRFSFYVSPIDLSTTVKTLYITLFDLYKVNSYIPMYFIGDNGLKWLFDISEHLGKDLYLYSDAYRSMMWAIPNIDKLCYQDLQGKIHCVSGVLEFLNLWDKDEYN